jgi:SAM-dependent methyltransferase
MQDRLARALVHLPGVSTLYRLLGKTPPDRLARIETIAPAVMTGSARWRCLNLGCGDDHIASTPDREWVNSDISRGVKADLYFDAFEMPLPLKDEEFDLVKAYDFLEHVPHVVFDTKRQPLRGDGFIIMMEELWRILKPGGVLDARFPALHNVNNFIDPTHTRQIAEETFRYYFLRDGKYRFYTSRHWELLAFDRTFRHNHYARLRKPR